MVAVDLTQQSDELLHGVVFQLTLAERGLLDEELDVSLLLFLCDALIGISGLCWIGRHEGLLIEFRGGDDTVGHFHGRHVELLRADAGVEGQVHLRLVTVSVCEVGLHGVIATRTVEDGLSVASHILTLEGGAAALYGHTVGIAQLWYDGHGGLLLHILLREVAVDGCGYCASLGLKRIGGHGEVVG